MFSDHNPMIVKSTTRKKTAKKKKAKLLECKQYATKQPMDH